jgi:uncharacterized protein (DUF2235 family)
MAVPTTNGANRTNGVNGNSSFSSSSTAHETERVPRKLILCFDGTGNQFSGSNADTNVVKILNKFDRHHTEQYHYYQSTSAQSPTAQVKRLPFFISWNWHLWGQ